MTDRPTPDAPVDEQTEWPHDGLDVEVVAPEIGADDLLSERVEEHEPAADEPEPEPGLRPEPELDAHDAAHAQPPVVEAATPLGGAPTTFAIGVASIVVASAAGIALLLTRRRR